MTTQSYPVTECKNVIYNLFAKPKYTQLYITKKAYIKLMCYINLIGDYEITGFGRVQDETITDFKIIKQQVRSAYVECDEDAVLEFIRTIPKDQLNEWELDWHSHVNMGTTPSGTDWDNYGTMSNLRGGKQFPIMIVNKYQDFTVKNYIAPNNTPSIQLFINDDEISKEEIDAIYSQVKDEIQANCTKYIAPVRQQITTYRNENFKWYGSTNNRNQAATEHCTCCGTALLTEHEFAIGLCEDCEIEIAEQKGEK